jgi:predicted ATP-dependent endonuclease of OLD family
MGNEEMLFAAHAILTEGQDDHGVIRELLRLKGTDIDAHSISIVNCDGANNLPDYINLCARLAIDFYVIHDEDSPTTNLKQNERNDQIAKAVTAATPTYPSLHTYVPDLESTISKVKHCGLETLLVSAQYPDLVKPVNEFVATRLGTGSQP